MLAIAMIVTPARASACTEPPPPPPAPALPLGASETDRGAHERAWKAAHYALREVQDREWRLTRQTQLFDRADSLVLARIDHKGETTRSSMPSNVPTATLTPLRWVKNTGAMAELELAFTAITTCGPKVAFDAWAGQPGDVLLVYLSGSDPQQANVLDAVAISSIVEPRALARLTAPAQ